MSSNRQKPDPNQSKGSKLVSTSSSGSPSKPPKSRGETQGVQGTRQRETGQGATSEKGRRVPSGGSDINGGPVPSSPHRISRSSQSPKINSPSELIDRDGNLPSPSARISKRDGGTEAASSQSPHSPRKDPPKVPAESTGKLDLRPKPVSRAIPAESMVLARNLKQTMHSNTNLICYRINDSPSSMNIGSKGSVREGLVKSFIHANFNPSHSYTMTDYRDYLILFSRSPQASSSLVNSGHANGTQKALFTLEEFATVRWRDALRFLHSGELPTKPDEKDGVLSIFRVLLNQRRSLENPDIATARSVTALEFRSNNFGLTESPPAKRQQLAVVMEKFLSVDPDNLRGLETYLKGLRVQVCQKQDEDPGSNSCKEKTITSLARPDDGHESKVSSPPRVVKYGGGSNDVSFYYNSNSKGCDRANEASGQLKSGYVTVTQYFQIHKGEKIRRPDLPLVNVGTRSKPTYIPPGFCILPEPHGNNASELSFGNLEEIISTANIPKWINNCEGKGEVRYPGLKMPLARDLRDCQVSITAQSLLIPCRIKKSPTIVYANEEKVETLSGAWKIEAIKLNRSPSRSTYKVAVLTVGSSQWTGKEQVSKTLKALGDRLRHHGIAVDSIELPKNVAMEHRKFDKHVHEGFQSELTSLVKTKPDVVVVVLPFEMRPLYDCIKRQCDLKIGIHNVCVIAPRFASNDNGYFFQIALKINLKCGGQNQHLKSGQKRAISLETTMIVGIDTITPPKKANEGARGVAAVVASLGGTLSQWPAAVQVLGNKPLHHEFSGLLKSRLDIWRKKHDNASPENMIIYHNGQAEKACIDEISRFQRSCRIKMTLIAVSKDHHANMQTLRFLDEAAKEKAIPNGAMIVRSRDDDKTWEFVVQGHKPFKAGTAPPVVSVVNATLPVRYSVLHDDIFSASDAREELEDLTHDMRYLSGCSTSSVSSTLPIYYVGLLCNRVQSYVRPWYHPKKKDQVRDAMSQDTVKIAKSIENTMFYI